MALYRRKSSKVWWVDVALPDGSRLRRTTGTENKQLAQEYHDRLKAERWKEHRLGIRPDVSFESAVEVFLQEKSHRRAHDTYAAMMDWWIAEFKGKALREITQEVIIKAIKKREKTNKPGTLNRYLAALKTMMRMACLKYQWIERVPMFFMYDEPRARVRWIRPDEVSRLIEALPDFMRPMARLSLTTGLRQSNVMSLKWSQVDLVKRVIEIDGGQMKNGQPAVIPLSDAAVNVVREQIGRHDEFVFTHKGKPIKRIDHRCWATAVNRAGIEDFRWHDMRHTWATTMVQNGVSEGVIQVLGTWETPGMVKKYAHHATESVRPYVGVADKVLGGVERGASKIAPAVLVAVA